MNAETNAQTAQKIDEVLRLRRARCEALGKDLFSDPAWDLLLQLYAATLRDRKLKLSDVSADVPSCTLARWVTVLQERGLMECEADALVPSCLWIGLSPAGMSRMSELFAKMRLTA